MSGPQAGCSLKAVTALTRALQRLFIWHKDQTPYCGLYLPTPSRSHPLFSSSSPAGLPSHCLAFSSCLRAFAWLFPPPARLFLPPTSKSQLQCHSLPGPPQPIRGFPLTLFSWSPGLCFMACVMMYYCLRACVLSNVHPPQTPDSSHRQGHLCASVLPRTGLGM